MIANRRERFHYVLDVIRGWTTLLKPPMQHNARGGGREAKGSHVQLRHDHRRPGDILRRRVLQVVSRCYRYLFHPRPGEMVGQLPRSREGRGRPHGKCHAAFQLHREIHDPLEACYSEEVHIHL